MLKPKIKLIIVAVLFSQILYFDSAFAEEQKDWSLKLDNTVNSKYVWRGINLVDDYVYQPSIATTYKWISICVWGSMETTNENHYPGHGDTAGDFTEIDYTLTIANSWKKLNYSLGGITYTFPNTGFDPTTEIFGSLGLDALLAPTVTAYYDADLTHGTYGTFAVSHKFENLLKLPGNAVLSATLGAQVGFASNDHNRFYYGCDKTAFTDALFTAGLPLAIGRYFTITPAAYYSTLIDDRVRDQMEDDENFWYGISLTVTF